MRLALMFTLVLVPICAIGQNKPYQAVSICDSESKVVGYMLDGKLYDLNHRVTYTLRQGQTYSTRVGKYGGGPLGLARCSQYELFDLRGVGVGCAEIGWDGFTVTSYNGQEVWHSCE